jgi:hypothetical protein
MSVPYSIRHAEVVALDDNSSQTVAVTDLEAGEVTEVAPTGRDRAEALESVVTQTDDDVETVVALGDKYWDLEKQDVATLVSLERRERVGRSGSTISEGPLFAVLEYDQHVVDGDRWDDTQQRRVELATLLEETATSRGELAEARYHLQDGLGHAI